MSRKDEIINDLKYLCREDSQISQTTAHKIFEAISWEWTENRDGDGKSSCKGNGYYGCEYWSESAIKTVYKVKDIEEAKGQIQSNDIRSLVTHEHVIPKNLFITYMDTLHKRGKEIEKEWLDSYKCLQYNSLFDRKNTSNQFFPAH